MRRFQRFSGLWAFLSVLAFTLGCGSEGATGDADNPFLQDQSNLSKADTQYMNPDGIEVEVDIEADVRVASNWSRDEAPALLGQYAMTYLRKQGDFYLESLAEDSTSDQRVEWRVDGVWMTAEQAKNVDGDQKTHFRIRGINAVLLNKAKNGVTVGSVFTAVVPVAPDEVWSKAGDTCADPDSHMALSASIYWYMWNPTKSTCKIETQEMSITVSKLVPADKITYPEYDLLVADKKITSVVLFGQIGDGEITESEAGVRNLATMARWLGQAGYTEVTPAPIGRRFAKTIGDVVMEIDMYSPHDFAGLGDHAHFANFQKALSEHEIVAYDGHSMLGASDFWSRPSYPDFYQIYLYGGCLGYEYYVRPILQGKGGWDKVDIMSSVVEVSADANEFAAPLLAKLEHAISHEYKVSWKDMLETVRRRVGDSTFGLSGVRENCFSPAGSLCGALPSDNAMVKRYEDIADVAIPDGKASGLVRAINVPDQGTIKALSIELDITHSYVGDLMITLEHEGTEVVVWDQAGGTNNDIQQSLKLKGFEGQAMEGRWTLLLVDVETGDKGTINSWALSFLL